MIDAAILLFFWTAVLLIGFRATRARRAGLEDYILAGRRLTLPMFVASLVPAFYGGVLGVGEFTWAYGIVNWLVMGLPYYVFAAVYALFFASKVRAAEGLTIPDHLERAYGRPAALVGAGLVFLLACPADELLMAGTLASWASGLPLSAAMALAGLAALAYMLKGGLRAEAWTGFLELAVMFGGFALVLPFAWAELGPPHLLADRLPPLHLAWHGGKPAVQLVAWFFVALWTIADPAFHQRCAAAQDPDTGRRGILVSIGFWAVFDLMTTTAGLYARAAAPDLEQPLRAFPALADRVLPPVARGLFLAGLSASMIAALHATAFLSALSLAKDGAGRLLRLGEADQEVWTRRAIVATWALAFALAWRLPSVVGLWYAIGSAVVPGLLLPMLGAYFERLRPAPAFALAASLGGWLVSSAWIALGRNGSYPGGLEPMFPGLAFSASLWALGLAERRLRAGGRGSPSSVRPPDG